MTTHRSLHPVLQKAVQLHGKVQAFVVNTIGPTVFCFGKKEPAWNITTKDLHEFPDGTVGKELGKMLSKCGFEPIAQAESHDVFHILLDYSTSFTDEIALQFFLRGNGKRSIASLGTSIGGWFLMPTRWKYLRESYDRGRQCIDLSQFCSKQVLYQDLSAIKASLFSSDHSPKIKMS